MVCKECFNEYASRQVSRDELRKTMTNDVFKGMTFKKPQRNDVKKRRKKCRKIKFGIPRIKKAARRLLLLARRTCASSAVNLFKVANVNTFENAL